MIYFAELDPGGPIKIGTSRDPYARMRSFQTPVIPRILALAQGGYTEEQALHRAFSAHRMRGEWFRPVPELLSLIQAVRSVPPTRVRISRGLPVKWRTR